jgi:hypothetical protein
MRFWILIPFVKHTRLGISASDREIARAFRSVQPARLTDAERAEIDRKAEAFSKKWAPAVTWTIITCARVSPTRRLLA